MAVAASTAAIVMFRHEKRTNTMSQTGKQLMRANGAFRPAPPSLRPGLTSEGSS